MIKIINKKVIKIILLLVILLSVISISNHCFALGDVTNWTWEPTVEYDTSLSEKAEPILGAIRVIGILISVGSLSFIGIKMMIGSVEEKSDYKQKLVPWVLGATMVFAMTFIPSIVYDIASETILKTSYSRGEKYKQGNEYFLAGYDEGIYEAQGILQTYYETHGSYDGCEVELGDVQRRALDAYRSDKYGYQGGRYIALNSIWMNIKNYGYDPESLVNGYRAAAEAIKEGVINVDRQPNVEINADTIKSIYQYYITKGSYGKGVATRLYWQGLLWGVSCK